MTPRLKGKFSEQIAEKIKAEFGIENVMALPQLDKIVVSVGLGKQLDGSKLKVKVKDEVVSDLALITGQRPVMTKAKKSVSNFKVRKGYEIGCMVTLRNDRMWELFDRLISLVIPRIKDFRGLNPKGFDGRGNYCFGVVEQGIFPEVNLAEAEFIHGMNFNIVFKNSTNEKSLMALRELGVPFARDEDQLRRS